jgi:hypothetical protein
VTLDEGPDRGDTFDFQMPVGSTSPSFRPGDRIVMGYQEDAAEDRFHLATLLNLPGDPLR